ncbi:MAG: response regulator, partial [Actinobacteria bacterium]|nr:response regulator [Actinomycetota bacterium]
MVERAYLLSKGRPVTIRVVIAEDEAIIRLDLKETLEEEGYEVVGETGRGDKAVELVR